MENTLVSKAKATITKTIQIP